jgi:cytosine deaminase
VLPKTLDLLRRARLANGAEVDVRLHDGVVAEISPPGELAVTDPAATLDLEGWMVLTAPAEPHAHLDKALSYELIQPPLGDLNSAVAAWREYAETMSVESVTGRARTQVLTMLANGISAQRTRGSCGH